MNRMSIAFCIILSSTPVFAQSLPWQSTLGFVTQPNHGAFRIEPLNRDGYTGFQLDSDRPTLIKR